jgi:hypothetical protein
MKRALVSVLAFGAFMFFGMHEVESASSPNPVRLAVNTCSGVNRLKGREACFRSYCGRIKDAKKKSTCFILSTKYLKNKSGKVVKSMKRLKRKFRKANMRKRRKVRGSKKRKRRKVRRSKKRKRRKVRGSKKRKRRKVRRSEKRKRRKVRRSKKVKTKKLSEIGSRVRNLRIRISKLIKEARGICAHTSNQRACMRRFNRRQLNRVPAN